MADVPAQQAMGLVQWIQILVGGGIAGLLTSLFATRIEWKRLKNEEAERSSFYEQQLFQARLSAYQSLTAVLAEFTAQLADAVPSTEDRETWGAAERAAVGEAVSDRYDAIRQQLMGSTLLFGSSMDDALGEWTSAVNDVCGWTWTIELPESSPSEAFFRCLHAQYGVLQAMRSDLHLPLLDAKLIDKLAR